MAIEGKYLVYISWLNILADKQQPNLAGEGNPLRKLIQKAFSDEPLTTDEIFDCGKYYQRMIDQYNDKNDAYIYLASILEFKYAVYRKK